MARSESTAALPLEVLRDETTALEAAILECLAKPAKRAVHKLRTSTRRIEAQLELLAMLPHLPGHARPRQKILRLLKKFRRAAGQVRDYDVQIDLIASIESPKSARHRDDVRKEARQLRRQLKSERQTHAQELVDLLKQEREDLPIAFRELNEALKPARSLSLSESDLTALALTWYRRRSPAAPPTPNDTELLHNIRKQAKLARYLAESAPEEASKAQRLAARFESLQEAGGEWHDWLLLCEVARKQLGDSARLPEQFATRATASLRVFERRIAKMTSKASALPAARLKREKLSSPRPKKLSNSIGINTSSSR